MTFCTKPWLPNRVHVFQWLMVVVLVYQTGLSRADCNCAIGRDLRAHLHQYITDMVPNITDGSRETYCRSVEVAQQCYLDGQMERCPGADIHVASISGLAFLCRDGGVTYRVYRDCVLKARAQLETCTSRVMESLGSIHGELLITSTEKADGVCRGINDYLGCSAKKVSQVCKGRKDAGQWYVNFIKNPFREITRNKTVCFEDPEPGSSGQDTNGPTLTFIILLTTLTFQARTPMVLL